MVDTVIKLFGINNCNTVKKAKDWLNEHAVAYEFVDFKKYSITPTLIHQWLELTTLDQLINRRGTTWRLLSDTEKLAAQTQNGAVALMIAKPSVIKRPVALYQQQILLGFDENSYANFFN